MSDQPTPDHMDRIAAALEAGRKIEAIKLYREATCKGLKEAKDFIDALAPKLYAQDPEKYARLAPGKGSGCASAVLVALALLAVAAWVISG